MTHLKQQNSEAQNSMGTGIGEPLYMRDYEIRARKLQAEAVAKAASGLAHKVTNAFGALASWIQTRLKPSTKKYHQPNLEGAGSS